MGLSGPMLRTDAVQKSKEHARDVATPEHRGPFPESRTYVTDDIFLAGALIASGKSFVNWFWRKGRANFDFNDPIACEQLSQGYHNGQLRVEPKMYGEALKFLKSRISEAVRKQKTLNLIP